MMGHEFPPPTAFGLPDQFETWRPHQIEAWQQIVDAPTRFVGMVAPTGAGKSLIYMTAGMLLPGRQIVVTGGKGLQDQAAGDFKAIDLYDIRGRANYPCRAFDGEWLALKPEGKEAQGCDNGPCQVGLPCTLREAGCDYYDTVRLAGMKKKVLTNYAYHLSQRKYSDGLGFIQLLVLDEAHVAGDELSKVLKIELGKWLLQVLGIGALEYGCGIADWSKWGSYHANTLRAKLDTKPTGKSAKEMIHRKRMQQAERTLRAVASMEAGDWIEDHTPDNLVFECLYPHRYAEALLFQGAKKVVLTSATLTEKTLRLLGIDKDEVTWVSCPSHFPVKRRPVTWVPTVKMHYKMGIGEKNVWANRIYQIIEQRGDVKGIVHTVSYDRAKDLYNRAPTAVRKRLMMQTPGAVEIFRGAESPMVLLSPSVMTGWDFPDDQCRFQVIAKLPFPDTRSKIIQARQELDKDYGAYLMMQQLVQAVGRGMRSETDWCENLIVDDQWDWARGKYKKFAPGWFWEAVGKSVTIPKPLGATLGG